MRISPTMPVASLPRESPAPPEAETEQAVKGASAQGSGNDVGERARDRRELSPEEAALAPASPSPQDRAVAVALDRTGHHHHDGGVCPICAGRIGRYAANQWAPDASGDGRDDPDAPSARATA